MLLIELLVVAGAIVLRRDLVRDVGRLLGICVVFGAIYSMTHVQLRYRAPIEAVMAVVVGVLLSRTWARIVGAAPAPTPSPF